MRFDDDQCFNAKEGNLIQSSPLRCKSKCQMLSCQVKRKSLVSYIACLYLSVFPELALDAIRAASWYAESEFGIQWKSFLLCYKDKLPPQSGHDERGSQWGMWSCRAAITSPAEGASTWSTPGHKRSRITSYPADTVLAAWHHSYSKENKEKTDINQQWGDKVVSDPLIETN